MNDIFFAVDFVTLAAVIESLTKNPAHVWGLLVGFIVDDEDG